MVHLKSISRNFDEGYIPPVIRPHKCQRKVSSSGATERSVELDPNTPQKANSVIRIRSVASFSRDTSISDDVKHDVLFLGHTAKDFF